MRQMTERVNDDPMRFVRPGRVCGTKQLSSDLAGKPAIDLRAKKKLIATANPARIGILSDQRESKELSSNLAGKRANDLEAKKKLIATLPNSEFALTPLPYMKYQNSNRNKNADPARVGILRATPLVGRRISLRAPNTQILIATTGIRK
jgi:hypothetical protein